MTDSRPRRFPSWIDAFLQYSAPTGSPEIYRRWAALAGISSALQRKVNILVFGQRLYPNVFTLLVGPPGIGKTMAVRSIRSLLNRLPKVILAPDMISGKERLTHHLKLSHKVELNLPGPFPGTPFTQAALSCLINEFSVFVRPNDTDMLYALMDLFDCGDVFNYSSFAHEEMRIENVHLNILAGITPKSVATNFGQNALGLGFTARLLMVYAEEQEKQPLFALKKPLPSDALLEDLREIHSMFGEFVLDPDAAEELEHIHLHGLNPRPNDPRFDEYIPRRVTHLVKVCCLISASHRSTKIITSSDVQEAKKTLLEMELHMHKAIGLIGQNPVKEAVKRIVVGVRVEYARTAKPVHESFLRRLLMEEIAPHYHLQTIEAMIATGDVQKIDGFEVPNRVFIPSSKVPT